MTTTNENKKEGGGARSIRRIITKNIEDKISLDILSGKITPDTELSYSENDFDFI